MGSFEEHMETQSKKLLTRKYEENVQKKARNINGN